MKLILAAWCIFFLALPASATKVRPISIDELAQNSELVIYGQIQLGQLIDGNCGVRYVVKIEESYKGRFERGRSVLFSSNKPLLTGSNYVLFLSKDSASFEPLVSTSSSGPGPDPARVKLCQQNRPPYTVNVWGTGAMKVTSTYASEAKMVVFDDFMVRMPKGRKVTKLDPGKRYDIDRDEGAIPFVGFRDLLIGKPTP